MLGMLASDLYLSFQFPSPVTSHRSFKPLRLNFQLGRRRKLEYLILRVSILYQEHGALAF